MKLKQLLKKGLTIITIYAIVTLCVFVQADRVERLEDKGFSTVNKGVAIKLNK